jgi:hypothetical protein
MSLKDGDNVLSDKEEIKQHKIAYYKTLFGSVVIPSIH